MTAEPRLRFNTRQRTHVGGDPLHQGLWLWTRMMYDYMAGATRDREEGPCLGSIVWLLISVMSAADHSLRYNTIIPFLNALGIRSWSSDRKLAMWCHSISIPLKFVYAQLTSSLMSGLKTSKARISSNSRQRSSHGLSSSSSQYKHTISSICFEVIDFSCYNMCLDQVFDSLNSNIERDLLDPKETEERIVRISVNSGSEVLWPGGIHRLGRLSTAVLA